MSDDEIIYRIRVGDEWACGGSRGSTTTKISKAKIWKKKHHAKSHISMVMKYIIHYSQKYRNKHKYKTNEPEIIEFKISDCPPDWVQISLPQNPVIADYLELLGYHNAAKLLRIPS